MEKIIVVARLKNSMLIVGRDDGDMGIRNPRILVVNHVQKMYDLTDMLMGFGEGKEDFWIPKSEVLCQRKAIEKIRNSYIEDESGIKIPKKKIVDLKGRVIKGGTH